MAKTSKIYFFPISLWLFSVVLIAPVILVPVLGGAYNSDLGDTFALFPLFIISGLLLSIPVFMITYFSYHLLVKRITSRLLLRVLMCTIAISGMLITFYITGGSAAPVFASVYAISIALASMISPLDIP
ncbi:MAG: hypothetical protein ACO1OQ_13655 [Rufibacter sp.]